MLAFPLTVLALTLTVSSSHLVVLHPADEQLPLVARVDKPYSWSLYPHTFNSSDGSLTYSTSKLPSWLSFDPQKLNFHGTPSSEDEGNPRITVTAKGSSGTASTSVTLCVTSYPGPTLNLPISQQFSAPAPSLSSVFILARNSALSTPSPALRIPPKWSFSIGFEYETFKSENELYYEARQRDGSALPDWMVFNPDAITVNGVVPSEFVISQPHVVSLSLYASDQKGYSASSQPFDLILADHELWMSAGSLPDINIIADAPFTFTFSSPADFLGVLIDGRAIQPDEITTLVVDTSPYGSWLKYDQGTRTLSGDLGNNSLAPGQNLPLLANLTAFNQSLRVPVHLAAIPSYFARSELPPINAAPGDAIRFNLKQFFANATEHDDVNLTVALQPPEAGDWLNLASAELVGTIPFDFAAPRITAVFTATSPLTHLTSHASLSIVSAPGAPPEGTKKGYHPFGLSAAAHSRLALGLGITFGVVGGLCFVAGLLAVIRRCARVEDTAIGGEEGRNVWSEEDKKWYGIGVQRGRGYGWADRDPNFTEKPRPTLDYRASYNARHGTQEQYANLGLGLRRVSERSQSEAGAPSNRIPGVMSKGEFFTKLRETVRVVSDKATGRKVSRKRPVIGKPMLPSQHAHASATDPAALVSYPPNPFGEPGLPSHPGSTIMTNSPSTSTADHSIPRRRADFAPPRSPDEVHLDDARHLRQHSSGSTASNTSERRHATEAVVQTASKATSIRGGRSGSGRSNVEPPLPANARPRLVPFTSASRVPVPRRPSSPAGLDDSIGVSPNKRVASQTAKVWRRDKRDGPGIVKAGSSDELQMGLHYVQSLGADPQAASESRPSWGCRLVSRRRGSEAEDLTVSEVFLTNYAIAHTIPTIHVT
ncbi:putative dystroglycan-type cadherin-like domains containing protein [Lyophyllum shimeji]|uniref:Dystroglycan-type cadherin-like domains containing protein n=1 Tax=Lyophyllum shimeji TaxID=47721 RepID=A0A9P3PU91_LYOSH|nr:putative dystroglycan-type cadherin-like domains containing protein [Lyophyllum shimeji]